MSRATPWSTSEVEAIVATYRQMLVAELSGQRYNKNLFRLFNFRKGPKLYCLKGDLWQQLWLEPDSYRAGVR